MRVDPRAGSGDLAPLLIQHGVKDVELATLGYGDIHITGNGPGGIPVQVGIEIKKLGDMVQCIENGRFVGHQLPGMLDCYDQMWLLVEGIWREGSSGLIEVPRGAGWSAMRGGTGGRGMTASAFQGFLFTMSIKLNLKVQLTGTRRQTVAWLSALNQWWTGKEYEDHRAYLSFDNSAALSIISRPTLLRRVAKELPGVGWERSGAVARHFHSVTDMVMAPASEWQHIAGIGKTTAARITEALEGRGKDK